MGITYIKDDEDIIPLLKVWHLQQLLRITSLLQHHLRTLAAQVALHRIPVLGL